MASGHRLSRAAHQLGFSLCVCACPPKLTQTHPRHSLHFLRTAGFSQSVGNEEEIQLKIRLVSVSVSSWTTSDDVSLTTVFLARSVMFNLARDIQMDEGALDSWNRDWLADADVLVLLLRVP
jgi:hypothetical protein